MFAAARRGGRRRNIPIPVFALVFVALCVLNSIAAAFRRCSRLCVYQGAAGRGLDLGLLIAISALGLGTSVTPSRRSAGAMSPP